MRVESPYTGWNIGCGFYLTKSILPTLELDISDNDVSGAASRIADWMTETGGLYARLIQGLNFGGKYEKVFLYSH